VIAMLVGEKNAVQLLRGAPLLTQAREQLPLAQTAVDQYTRAVGAVKSLDQRGITLAATGQVTKAQHMVRRALTSVLRPVL
jgi:hypothetical protein